MRTLIIFLLMLNHEAGEAQDLIWGWALPTVGGGSEIAGLCMTPDGGTMVHGTFVSGTLDLDPSAASHFVTTTIGGFLPGSATFIAKYDSTGAFSWGYEYDTDEAFINQMAVTTVGEIVLAIVHTGTVDVDPTSNTHWASGSGTAIVRFNSSGSFSGAVEMPGLFQTRMKPRPDGGLYLLGSYLDQIDLGVLGLDTVVVSNGAWDAIVLSLDSQNQVAWVGSLGGAQNDYPQWLTARGDELMVAVSHPWAGTYSMDSDPGVQYTPVQFDGGGVLMVKMDPYGNLLHSFPMDLDATQALRCEFLPDRSYVMTVNLYGNTLNDADPGPGTILVDSNLGQTLMLKLDSLDQLIWHKQIEGTLSQRIWDLDVLEGEKQMVITGHFWESIDLDVGEGVDLHSSNSNISFFMAGYCIENGTYDWGYSSDGDGVSCGYAIAGSKKGGLLIGGAGSSGMDLDPGANTFDPNNSVRNAILAKYRPGPSCFEQLVGIDVGTSGSLPFTMFPNPCSDRIWVKTGHTPGMKWEWSMLDAIGTCIQRGVSSRPVLELDLNFLAPGAYHICLTDQGSTSCGKIIVFE